MNKHTLKVLTNIVEKIFEGALLLVFLVLIIVVVVQVVGRAGVFDSPVWTEELSRFALLYLAALGVGLSITSGDLVNVDIVCEALPYPFPWFLRFISSLITVALSISLLLPAWKYTMIGELQTSSALGLRMDFVHVSIFILLLSLTFFSLLRIISMMYGIADGRPDNSSKPEEER